MNFDPAAILRPRWQSGDGSALLRPWWGMSPFTLLFRAVVQGAMATVLMVVLWRVRTGELLPEDEVLGDERKKIVTGATVFAVLAACWLVYSLLRVVVSVLEMPSRHTVEGTVVSVSERRRWGFLPSIVQNQLWNRRDQGIDRRRQHTVLTVQTDSGQQAWSVSSRKASGLQPGAEVRVVATAINGYVRSITPIGPTAGG